MPSRKSNQFNNLVQGKSLSSVPKSMRNRYPQSKNEVIAQTQHFFEKNAFFSVQIDEVKDYEDIKWRVIDKEADLAYAKLADITGIKDEDLMSIIGYDDENLKVTIQTQPGSNVPLSKKVVELPNGKDPFKTEEMIISQSEK